MAQDWEEREGRSSCRAVGLIWEMVETRHCVGRGQKPAEALGALLEECPMACTTKERPWPSPAPDGTYQTYDWWSDTLQGV